MGVRRLKSLLLGTASRQLWIARQWWFTMYPDGDVRGREQLIGRDDSQSA